MTEKTKDSALLVGSVQRQLAHAALVLWGVPGGRWLARRVIALHDRLTVMQHYGRWPDRPDALFNDFLYRLKSGSEIESPLRRRLTDKARAKAYVEERLGPGMTVPTLAVLATPGEIADYLPPVFPVAVKPTHSSGRLLRVGSREDWAAARDRITAWLKHDFFRQSLERNYAGLAKRVIVEPWLDEALRYEGSVHCRGGVPKVVSIIERYSKSRQSYRPDRQPLGVSLGFPLTEFALSDWEFFEPLLSAAARLSAGLSYIRVDFYTDGRRLLLGELTNVPAGGRGRFFPENGEEIFSRAFFAPPP